MLCAKCGAENPAGKRFCGDCGAPLANRCGQCGAENPPEKKFCGDCGGLLGTAVAAAVAPSSPQRSAPNIRVTPEQPDASAVIEGERKTVTALFADIKGSTELMEDLDPKEARAIIDPALKLMIDAAHRYDGYVVQSTGVMASSRCSARRSLTRIIRKGPCTRRCDCRRSWNATRQDCARPGTCRSKGAWA
jgi:class 3 adenylate cyclase